MKIVNLNEYITGTNLVETSAEALKNINGGCTVKIGRCKKDGTYWVAAVTNPCSQQATHTAQALSKAKSINITPGTFVTFTF